MLLEFSLFTSFVLWWMTKGDLKSWIGIVCPRRTSLHSNWLFIVFKQVLASLNSICRSLFFSLSFRNWQFPSAGKDPTFQRSSVYHLSMHIGSLKSCLDVYDRKKVLDSIIALALAVFRCRWSMFSGEGIGGMIDDILAWESTSLPLTYEQHVSQYEDWPAGR